MILPDDVKCKICGRVFCCSKCRSNHQEKIHSSIERDENVNKDNEIISGIFLISCAICQNQPFILYPNISDDLLKHIAKNHLPLRCKKCLKLYTTIEELLIFSKCTNEKHECNLLENKNVNSNNNNNNDNNSINNKSNENEIKIQQQNANDNCTSTGTQTSPYLSSIPSSSADGARNIISSTEFIYNNNNIIEILTPIPMLNLLQSKIKGKSHESINNMNLTIDSVSSIRNFSYLTNSSLISCGDGGNSQQLQQHQQQRISIEAKIENVRKTTTSTPVPTKISMKIQRKYGGGGNGGGSGFVDVLSSCQVSSIHGTSTESSSNSSPQDSNSGTPPSPLTKPILKANEKIVTTQKIRNRGKMSTSATPLRQVMSKSIQKALAEHGFVRGAHPKKILNSADSSTSFSASTSYSPLDLRTSPVIRRTSCEATEKNNSSESDNCHSSCKKYNRNNKQKEIHFTSNKFTTQSILISSSTSKKLEFEKSNTIYKTCHQSYEFLRTTSSSQKLQNVQESPQEEEEEEEEYRRRMNKKINDQQEEQQKHQHYLSATPKISGLLSMPLKKTISFETPNNPDCGGDSGSDDVPDEVFYTPVKSPPKVSSSSEKSNDEDKVYRYYLTKNRNFFKETLPEQQKTNNKSENSRRGKLWSLLTSVIRFKSFGGTPATTTNTEILTDKKYKNENSLSLIKRCATFAGVLTKAKLLSANNDDDNNDITSNHSQKRKRSSTYDTSSSAPVKPSISYPTFYTSHEFDSPPKRIRRIQGRKPIERMRRQL